jgi:hypothetical protein
MQISIGQFLPINCIPKAVAKLAIHLFQYLVINYNQLAINHPHSYAPMILSNTVLVVIDGRLKTDTVEKHANPYLKENDY